MASITMTDGTTVELNETFLATLSTKQLLETHNEIADTSLKSWKQSKAKLITRVLDEANIPAGSAANPDGEAKSKDEKAAKKERKKKTANKKKAQQEVRTGRKMPRSYQMLQLIVEASEQGVGLSGEFLADKLNTSRASIASYMSYFRKGLKGHDCIPIVNGADGFGYHLQTKDDIAAAKAGIAARTPEAAE